MDMSKRTRIRPSLRLLRWFAAVPLLGLVVPMVLAADSVRPPPQIDVSQRNRQFSPDVLTIKVGTVLHIENDDNVTHHVYVDQPGMHFDSGEQPVGTTVDLRFDHPGTYDVQCAIHPTMHLLVKVQ